MIDANQSDVSRVRSLGKTVQSMASLACPLLSCALYIVLYSLVFGIGYHALVITFALEIKIGLWFYPLFLLAVWVIFNIMFNYTMCVLTKPGSPEKIPSYFLNQIYNKCNKCGITKPPRTHHCSICNECVLQMDRKNIDYEDHCPWIGTCVGHHNRRYFNNFLSYTTFGLGCMLIMSQFRRMDQLVFALVITLFIVLLLFTSYHWYITLKGQTSLEICFADPRYRPQESFSHNLKIVYGTSNIFMCFMPSITPLDNWGNQWEVV